MSQWLRRAGGWVADNLLLLLVIGAIAVAVVVLRTPGSRVSSVAQVDAILTGGRPTLVEFYSNT